MIRNPAMLQEWKEQHARSQPADCWRNLRIFEALYEQARSLGVLSLADPLEGWEDTLQLASKLHSTTEVP